MTTRRRGFRRPFRGLRRSRNFKLLWLRGAPDQQSFGATGTTFVVLEVTPPSNSTLLGGFVSGYALSEAAGARIDVLTWLLVGQATLDADDMTNPYVMGAWPLSVPSTARVSVPWTRHLSAQENIDADRAFTSFEDRFRASRRVDENNTTAFLVVRNEGDGATVFQATASLLFRVP